MYKIWHGENVALVLESESLPYVMRIARELHARNPEAGTYVTKGCEHYAKYKNNVKWEKSGLTS